MTKQSLYLILYLVGTFWIAGAWMIYAISAYGGWSENVMPKRTIEANRKSAVWVTVAVLCFAITAILFYGKT